MSEMQTKKEVATVSESQAATSRVDGVGSEQTVPGRLPSGPGPSLRSLRAEAEIHAISRTLEQTGWNRRRAAQLLSISYRGLLYKIRQHNITPESRDPLVSFAQRAKI